MLACEETLAFFYLSPVMPSCVRARAKERKSHTCSKYTLEAWFDTPGQFNTTIMIIISDKGKHVFFVAASYTARFGFHNSFCNFWIYTLYSTAPSKHMFWHGIVSFQVDIFNRSMSTAAYTRNRQFVCRHIIRLVTIVRIPCFELLKTQRKRRDNIHCHVCRSSTCSNITHSRQYITLPRNIDR